MIKLSCEVIKDLLPLYYDNICSKDSKIIIEAHIDECVSCANELEKYKIQLPLNAESKEKNISDSKELEKISNYWNKSKRNSMLKGLLISCLLFSFIFISFTFSFVPVPINKVTIKDVSLLNNGYMVYHSKINDDYRLNRLKYSMDVDGNFYLTPLRPLFKIKNSRATSLKDGYDIFSIEHQQLNNDGKEIKALYYGTPKNNILIWKKGMELPSASNEVESQFIFN